MAVPRRNNRQNPGLNWLMTVFAISAGLLVLHLLRPKPHLGQTDYFHLHKNKLIDQEAEYPVVFYELVLEEPNLRRYVAKENWFGSPAQNMTIHRWLNAIVHFDEGYANKLIDELFEVMKETNMDAFFFETKGVSYQNSYSKAFEFVLIRSQQLFDFADEQQDSSTFGDLLRCGEIEKPQQQSGEGASDDDQGNGFGCVFKNLEGESTLVAPKRFPETEQNVYGHLGAFIKRAPKRQTLYFWRLAVETFLGKLEEDKSKTYWFSTDGRGVKWLHMRIDPNPKYYDYQPFANET